MKAMQIKKIFIVILIISSCKPIKDDSEKDNIEIPSEISDSNQGAMDPIDPKKSPPSEGTQPDKFFSENIEFVISRIYDFIEVGAEDKGSFENHVKGHLANASLLDQRVTFDPYVGIAGADREKVYQELKVYIEACLAYFQENDFQKATKEQLRPRCSIGVFKLIASFDRSLNEYKGNCFPIFKHLYKIYGVDNEDGLQIFLQALDGAFIVYGEHFSIDQVFGLIKKEQYQKSLFLGFISLIGDAIARFHENNYLFKSVIEANSSIIYSFSEHTDLTTSQIASKLLERVRGKAVELSISGEALAQISNAIIAHAVKYEVEDPKEIEKLAAMIEEVYKSADELNYFLVESKRYFDMTINANPLAYHLRYSDDHFDPFVRSARLKIVADLINIPSIPSSQTQGFNEYIQGVEGELFLAEGFNFARLNTFNYMIAHKYRNHFMFTTNGRFDSVDKELRDLENKYRTLERTFDDFSAKIDASYKNFENKFLEKRSKLDADATTPSSKLEDLANNFNEEMQKLIEEYRAEYKLILNAYLSERKNGFAAVVEAAKNVPQSIDLKFDFKDFQREFSEINHQNYITLHTSYLEKILLLLAEKPHQFYCPKLEKSLDFLTPIGCSQENASYDIRVATKDRAEDFIEHIDRINAFFRELKKPDLLNDLNKQFSEELELFKSKKFQDYFIKVELLDKNPENTILDIEQINAMRAEWESIFSKRYLIAPTQSIEKIKSFLESSDSSIKHHHIPTITRDLTFGLIYSNDDALLLNSFADLEVITHQASSEGGVMNHTNNAYIFSHLADTFYFLKSRKPEFLTKAFSSISGKEISLGEFIDDFFAQGWSHYIELFPLSQTPQPDLGSIGKVDLTEVGVEFRTDSSKDFASKVCLYKLSINPNAHASGKELEKRACEYTVDQ